MKFVRITLLPAVMLTLIAAATIASAQSADLPARFQAANRLYEQGKYADAADGYQAILSKGKGSPSIFFNLGNALYRCGRFGRAIYYYRRAQSLEPRDPDIAANLQFARRQVSGGMTPDPSWQERFLERLSLNEWAGILTAVFWLWLAVVAWGEWRPEKKTLTASWRIAGGLAVIVVGVCLGLVIADRLNKRLAVVVTNEAVVRYGPLAESKSYFNLRDGVEVTVIDRKDEWIQVTDPIQRSGWVRADQVWFLNSDTPQSLVPSSKPKPERVPALSQAR